MEKKYIEEVEEKFNINVDYIDDLGLWITGRYGIIYIFNFKGMPEDERDLDTVEFESATMADFPSVGDAAKADLEYYFLPHLDEEDAAEGFSVYKFKIPWLVPQSNITYKNIFFIKCTNNGISYFACDTIAALHSFVQYVISRRIPEGYRYGYPYARELGWYLIDGYGYDAIECWPSDTEWKSENELKHYAEGLYSVITDDFNLAKIESLCQFTIPFWDGDITVRKEKIYAIKSNVGTYFASPNRYALRAAVTCLNGWRNQQTEEKIQKEMKNHDNVSNIVVVNNTINGDFVAGEKHVGAEVSNVAAGGTGIQVNK